jgi:hypothetical protein
MCWEVCLISDTVHEPTQNCLAYISIAIRRLNNVTVILLAIGPKVYGFKSGRSDGFLRAIKILFCRESKAVGPTS